MQILNDVDLSNLNTFGLPARSRYYTELNEISELPEIFRFVKESAIPFMVLGGGSNIIFTQDFTGLILRTVNKGIQITEQTEEFVIVEAQAGEIWHDFILWTLDNHLTGLENLSLIPGAVGAAPVQNIGAYGVEAKDSIYSITCFDTHENSFKTFSNVEADFSYRDSIFKSQYPNRFIISSVEFKLSRKFKPNLQYGPLQTLQPLYDSGQLTAKDVADTVCRIRMEKLPDPVIMGNAGSFFKNPVVDLQHAEQILAKYPEAVNHAQAGDRVKFAAGWLIDRAGLKGVQVGGAAVHDKQALVLVNKDHATVDDVQALVKQIKEKIYELYQIELEIEPSFV